MAKVYERSSEMKVAVHFLDGEVIKGTTSDLNPEGRGFYLNIYGERNERAFVNHSAVKAVFILKDFTGTTRHQRRKSGD